MNNFTKIMMSLGSVALFVSPAFATPPPIPGPLAGVFGPVGLVIAAIGMAGYAAIRHFRR